MEKKTIFILTNSFESGGAERAISRLLPHLSKKYDVHLILLKNNIFYEIPENITVTSLSSIHHNFLLILLLPIYVLKLRSLIKKYNPSKVISFLEIANFINILSHKKSVISFRTSLQFFDEGLIKRTYHFLITLLYPRAQKIILNSKENALKIEEELHMSSQKIRTIYNPINHYEVNKLSPKNINTSMFPKNKVVFITIGRLDHQKRLDILIELFAKHSLENSILLVIGEGNEKEKLSQLLQKDELSHRIFLLGKQKNIFPYLAYADYFIFSSEVEGFPNVLIEAMACNLPIITSDFKTGAREIINQELNYDQKISYPYYGPNGVLLSMNTFINDFAKIDFDKLHQKQKGIERFEIESVTQQWIKIIDEKM